MDGGGWLISRASPDVFYLCCVIIAVASTYGCCWKLSVGNGGSKKSGDRVDTTLVNIDLCSFFPLLSVAHYSSLPCLYIRRPRKTPKEAAETTLSSSRISRQQLEAA